MSGKILYSCGHELHYHDTPQDLDWQSEVPCPDCRKENSNADTQTETEENN